MITITVTHDASEDLRAEYDRLHAAILRGVGIATTGVQIDIVSNKLHGQVLNQRTGNLVRNVIVLPVSDADGVVTGTVGVGSTAWYGKVHEFGTTQSYDIYPKNGRALRWFSGGAAVFAAHVVHPPFKERSFVRSSLRELTDDGRIKAWIEGAL